MASKVESWLILLILLLSCSLGVAHALITPAWANVEEAGHFEYVRYIVEAGKLPQPGDPNSEIRQRILQSFVWKHHRWGSAGQMANGRLISELGLFAAEDWAHLRDTLSRQPGYETITPETSIAVPQFEEPPAYYLYVAAFQLIVPRQPVETQLLVGRLSSVLLGMLTVWLAYRAASELFPDSPYIRVAIPAALALLPSFVILSSAVNNTIAAAAAVSLIIWASVRFIRRGFKVGTLLLLAAGVAACLLSKPSAYFALPLAVLALALALRQPWLKWIGTGVLAGAVVIILLLFNWQWPSSWYPLDRRWSPVRDDALLGSRVFVVRGGEGMVFQMVPAYTVQRMRGERVTLGVWMRNGESTDLPLPGLWAAPNEGNLEPLPVSAGEIRTDTGWQFQAATLTIPADTQCLAVRFDVPPDETVEYDGLVLASGTRPLDEPPVYANRSGTRGDWGATTFVNLILNGSAERGQPLIRTEVQEILPSQVARYLNVNPRLASLLDWRANWPTLNQSIRWLFTSFWSRFASANPGLPRHIVLVLAVLSVASGAGLLMYTVRAGKERPVWQRRSLALVGVAAMLAIVTAILRLDAFVFPGHCDFYQGRFISTGYYIIPGALPLLTVWYVGLHQLVPRRHQRWLLAALVAGFFFMTVGSLLGHQIPDFLLAYGSEPASTLWTWLWGWTP